MKKIYRLHITIKLLSLNLEENPLLAHWKPPHAKIGDRYCLLKREMRNGINTREIIQNRQDPCFPHRGGAASAPVLGFGVHDRFNFFSGSFNTRALQSWVLEQSSTFPALRSFLPLLLKGSKSNNLHLVEIICSIFLNPHENQPCTKTSTSLRHTCTTTAPPRLHSHHLAMRLQWSSGNAWTSLKSLV